MPRSLIQPVDDAPARIQNIRLGLDVDDAADLEQGLTGRRVYNIEINDTRTELSVFDVLEQAPEFTPGRTDNGYKINAIRLNNTESNYLYTLEVDILPFVLKSPFFVPIEWTWESTVIEIPAWVDRKGKPITTTAGEPIVGQVRRIKCWIFTGTRNIPGVPKWFRDYGVSVNSDRVKIDGETFKPNELQLQKLSLGKYEQQEIDGTEYTYRPVTFEFWFNPLTWTTEVLNLGFIEMVKRLELVDTGKEDPDTGTPIQKRVPRYYQQRAVDSKGQETKTRVFLDENGKRPRDKGGNVKTKLDPADIVTLKFDLEEQLPYTRLLK